LESWRTVPLKKVMLRMKHTTVVLMYESLLMAAGVVNGADVERGSEVLPFVACAKPKSKITRGSAASPNRNIPLIY
jgi:hypothetical protein